MNRIIISLLAVGFLALAGCDETPTTSHVTVRVGMSREDLRQRFGEPVRVERVASGGEDWYYRFLSWTTKPTGSSETVEVGSQRMSYVSAGLEASRDVNEKPIHLSPDGFVIEPIPEGKVVTELRSH